MKAHVLEKTAPCTTATPLNPWNGSVKGKQSKSPQESKSHRLDGKEGYTRAALTRNGKIPFLAISAMLGGGGSTVKSPPRAAPCGPNILNPSFYFRAFCGCMHPRSLSLFSPSSPSLPPSPPSLPPSLLTLRRRPPSDHEAQSRHRGPAKCGQVHPL